MVVTDVNALLRKRKPSLIHRAQLRNSAQSIVANIREGMGRDPGPDRNKSYRTARGSSEETDEHLHTNFTDRRLPLRAYRSLHNRLAVIVKMLDNAMQ